MTLDELQSKLEQINAAAKVRDEHLHVQFTFYANGQGAVSIFNNYGLADYEFRFASVYEVPVALEHALKVAERKHA